MSLKAKELREQRGAIVKQMEAIIKKADQEGRGLTPEEEAKYESLNAAQEALKDKADAIEEEERNNAPELVYSSENGSDRIFDVPLSQMKSKTKGWAPESSGIRVAVDAADRFLDEKRSKGVMLGTYIRWKVKGTQNDTEARALSGLESGTAKNTIPTELSNQLIDLLRARTVIGRSGAIYLTMDTNNYAIAKMTGDVPAGWRDELESVPTGDPTFSRVDFAAKNLGGLVRLSRELFDDNTVGLDQGILRAFAEKFAVEFDSAILNGDGVKKPLGITAYANKQVIDKGANGGAITSYTDLVRAYRLLMDANYEGPTAAIMAPREWEAYTNLVDANNNPLQMPRGIQQLPFLATTSMPTNLDAGTSGTTGSQMIIADFRNLAVAMRQAVSMRILTERYADTNEVGIVTTMRGDAQPLRENAFVVVDHIIPQS